MKGLLIKEYYTLQKYAKTYLLYIVLFGGVMVFSGQIAIFSAISVVFLSSIPISSFSIDDVSGWHRMAQTTPVERKNVVGVKYLLVLFMTAFLLVLSPIMILLAKLRNPATFVVSEALISMLVSIVVMCLGTMAVFPFLFRYGTEKGRLMIMMIFGGIAGTIVLVSWLLQYLPATMRDASAVVVLPVLLIGLLLVLVLAVVISYNASCHIYAKKEF